jgi:hypothetical protein
MSHRVTCLAGGSGGGNPLAGIPGMEGRVPFPFGSMSGHGAGSSSVDGRSRKYRDGGWTVPACAPFAGLPLSIVRTPSPVVPLKCEQAPDKWEGEHGAATQCMPLQQQQQQSLFTFYAREHTHDCMGAV